MWKGKDRKKLSGKENLFHIVSGTPIRLPHPRASRGHQIMTKNQKKRPL